MSAFRAPVGHPCESHQCDWCATCRAGRCCAGTRAGASTPASPAASEVNELVELVAEDVRHRVGVADLVALDSLRRQARRAFPVFLDRESSDAGPAPRLRDQFPGPSRAALPPPKADPVPIFPPLEKETKTINKEKKSQ
jgi:hypothetical protein